MDAKNKPIKIPKLKVKYKHPHKAKLADEEFKEVKLQSKKMRANPSQFKKIPTAIQEALHSFERFPKNWKEAVKHGRVEAIKKGSIVLNSDIGNPDAQLNDVKTERVSEMLYYGKAIEHPIVLKYKDKKTNKVYFYLVAGNTRATHIGYGVKVLVLYV